MMGWITVCFYVVEVTSDEFGMRLFPSTYLIFSLFLVLFMGLIVLFSTIHEYKICHPTYKLISHCACRIFHLILLLLGYKLTPVN